MIRMMGLMFMAMMLFSTEAVSRVVVKEHPPACRHGYAGCIGDCHRLLGAGSSCAQTMTSSYCGARFVRCTEACNRCR